MRQWVVIDWCTGQELTGNQIIKITDEQAPICSAPPDFLDEIPTDEGLCTGTYEVPAPLVVFECSDYNYSVSYKLRDDNGQPFENPIFDNVTFSASTGLYTISGLPQDTTWIIYTLTDVCGNISQCFTEVLIVDLEAPIPVCEGFTVVGLADQGWADIFALSIDDGSFDNCEVTKYEVRRLSTNCGFPSDLQFGDKVNFCCSDVDAGYIKVVLRVYDAAGNYNDCIVNVNVQDKINPIITCPADKFIQCTQDFLDLSLTGIATGTDNCSVEITHTDQISLDDCGKGIVRRTWRATDPQGRSATCIQRITVGDNNPFGANNINWPSDLEIDGCDADNITPEDLNSLPILSNTDCVNIATSYDDNIFYNVPDYCIKVLRTWKIVDWCNYDPQNPEFYTYTQKISIRNNVAPTFASCTDQLFTSTDGDCQEEVTIEVTATDDCTPDALLKYSYTIDIDDNGSIDFNGVTNSFTRTLEAGTHKVTWKVIDACDNESICMMIVTVEDTKRPTPICLGEVVWVIGEDGSTEIWANDFDLKSEAACGDDGDLIFSFNEAGTQLSLFFDCTDIPNGIAEEIPLQMYVIDDSGNSEFCDVILILQDSQSSDACQDQTGNRATIAGSIMSINNEGVVDIEVELKEMEDQDSEIQLTVNSGGFTFEDIHFYDDYAVAPYKNDDVNNGVSTLDLVMIQRHILGLSELDSPYKLIAADVNGNDKISASDLLMMRKVILGISNDFGDNTSWRFIPTTYEIEDPTDPFGFPEQILLEELYVSDMDIDFTAIKTGDVNGNATVNLKSTDINSETRSGAKQFFIANQNFEKGSNVSVDVLANEVSSIIGMQFTIEYDATKLAFSTIQGENLMIQKYNVVEHNGSITISWNTASDVELSSDDVLFNMQFRSKSTGDLTQAITMNSTSINAEMYDSRLNVFDLGLEIGARQLVETVGTQLYQNSPNPFKGMTSIGFDLQEKGMATLAIYDVTGKEVYRITNEFSRGFNQMTIDVNTLGATSGILYYTLRSGDFIDTKKMILVD